tara:strand:- start:185 stop:430 length:246 start_codon:yes stop_codon:yes gene_type:complete
MEMMSLILIILIVLTALILSVSFFSRKSENYSYKQDTIKHQIMEKITYERKKAALNEMKRDGQIDNDEFNNMLKEIEKQKN